MTKWRETPLDGREAQLFKGRGRELALARNLFYPPLPRDGRKVLHFTGIGGIGKTGLTRAILRELRARHDERSSLVPIGLPPAFAAVDFAEAWSLDPIQALLQIRLQLGLTLPASRFPVFDFAFGRLHRERFASGDVLCQYGLTNPDGAIGQRLTGVLPRVACDGARLQDAVEIIKDVIDNVPALNIAFKYLNRAFASGLEQLDRRTEPLLKEVSDAAVASLETRLPECLGVDIRNVLAHLEPRPAVLVVADTVERIAPQDVSAADTWLRELIIAGPGVAFILAGRDTLAWSEREQLPSRDWSRIVEERELGELEPADVEAILDAFPVPEPEVRAAMRDGVAGHPFYLGLQLDIYRDVAEGGGTPTTGQFARSRPLILRRFKEHLHEGLKATFRTLAHARVFDEALLEALRGLPGGLIGPDPFAQVLRYSIVDGSPDTGWRLHDLYQQIEREELGRESPLLQRRIDEALFGSWDARANPPDVHSVASDHERALREALHHRLLTDPREGPGWLLDRFKLLFDAGRYTLLRDLSIVTLAAAEGTLGPDDTGIASTFGNLGIVQRELGELAAARASQERALAINEQRLPTCHPHTLRLMRGLAVTLGMLDQAERAHELRERIRACAGSPPT